MKYVLLFTVPQEFKEFLISSSNKTKEIPSPFLKLLQFLFQSSLQQYGISSRES